MKKTDRTGNTNACLSVFVFDLEMNRVFFCLIGAYRIKEARW